MQISDKKACIPGNAYFRTSAGCTGKARRSRICFINIQSWKTKNGASVDVNNHIAQHHLETKHQFQWDSATCITYSTDYYIRITLEIRFTYLEQRQTITGTYYRAACAAQLKIRFSVVCAEKRPPRGRGDTRVWYRETIFSQMVS